MTFLPNLGGFGWSAFSPRFARGWSGWCGHGYGRWSLALVVPVNPYSKRVVVEPEVPKTRTVLISWNLFWTLSPGASKRTAQTCD